MHHSKKKLSHGKRKQMVRWRLVLERHYLTVVQISLFSPIDVAQTSVMGVGVVGSKGWVGGRRATPSWSAIRVSHSSWMRNAVWRWRGASRRIVGGSGVSCWGREIYLAGGRSLVWCPSVLWQAGWTLQCWQDKTTQPTEFPPALWQATRIVEGGQRQRLQSAAVHPLMARGNGLQVHPQSVDNKEGPVYCGHFF